MLDNGRYDVTVLNRGTRGQEINSSIDFIKADRKDPLEMEKALKGRYFDVVFDFSGYDAEDIRIALNALRRNVDHYIFCSSVAVCKQPPLQHWPLTEKHIKCSSLADDAYGFNKWQAENILWQEQTENQLNVTTVRPTYLYGPYNYHKRELLIFERALSGLPIAISGDGENLIQFGYVSDLAEAMLVMANNEKAFGEAFNVSGKELLTVNDFIYLAAKAVEKDIVIIHTDYSNYKIDVEGFARLPDVHRFADISKAKDLLGIEPRTNISEGIRKTASWWQITEGQK